MSLTVPDMVAYRGREVPVGAVAISCPVVTVSPAFTTGCDASPIYCLRGRMTRFGSGVSMESSVSVVRCFENVIPFAKRAMVYA